MGQDRRPRRRRRRARAGARPGRRRAELDGLVDVFMPALPRRAGARGRAATCRLRPGSAGGRAARSSSHLLVAETHGYRLHLVDHPPAFDRDGHVRRRRAATTRTTRGGSGSCAAPRSSTCAPATAPPDVIHIHDWHAVPALLLRDGAARARTRRSARAAFVLTVHNLAYHGWTPAAQVPELGPRRRGALPKGAGRARPPAGRHRAGRARQHRQPGLRRARRSTPEIGHGPRRRAARARATGSSGSSTASTPTSGIPATDAALAGDVLARGSIRQGALPRGAARASSASTRPTRGRSCR